MLSHCPRSGDFFNLVIPHAADFDDLSKKLQQDSFTNSIITSLQSDPTSMPHYSLVCNRLYFKNRLVLPAKSPLTATVMHEAHGSPVGGHGGVLKTLKRLQQHFFWQNMKQDVHDFVQNCLSCQRGKSTTQAPAGPLQPIHLPNHIWENLSLDFISGLPKSNGFDVILGVVDRFSKYAHFLGLSRPFTTKAVAALFTREIIRLHDIPHSIIFDRDPIFLSSFSKELFKLSGTNLRMSTSYHPQTYGQTEVVNHCLENYLHCLCQDHPKSWYKFLHWEELSYNTGFHSSSGFTPYRVVYGKDLPTLLPFIPGNTNLTELEECFLERDAIMDTVKTNLLAAQQRMKLQADSHRREVDYNIGDMVFLWIQPYRQKTLSKKKFEKLSARCFGPYPIVRKIGNVAYELQLPSSTRIHPVFHDSLVKLAHGCDPQASLPVLPLNDDYEFLLESEQVVGSRVISNNGTPDVELLIRWNDHSSKKASWESYDYLATQFPHFSLEDKASFLGGSNDRIPKPLLVYSRKRRNN